MLYCNGASSYGWAKDVLIEAKQWPNTGLFGSGSISVEFWLYQAGAPKVNLHAPFHFGDSDIVGGWCDDNPNDGINPYYCNGKISMTIGGT